MYNYRDIQLNNINIKKIYGSTPVKAKTKEANYLILKNSLFFKFLKIIGMFPITINDDGTVQFKYNSWLIVYTVFVFLLLLAYFVFDLYTIISNMIVIPFTFEEAIFYSAWLTGVPLLAIHFIFLLETKKLAVYLNDWKKFLDRLESVTHRRPCYIESKFWIWLFTLTMGLVSIIMFFSVDLLNTLLDQFELNKPIHYALLLSFYYSDLILYVLAFLWFLFTYYIKLSGLVIITDIESHKWKKRTSMAEYTYLWMELRRLCIGLGNTCSFTYLALSMFIFGYSLPFLYLGVYLLRQGNYAQIAVAFHGLMYISLLGEACHQATNMIGPQFEARLTSLLISGKVAEYESEVLEFIKTINGAMPYVPIGGFFNFDRGINAPLYSSVITYFIIIIQLRTDELHHNRGATNFTS